MNNMRRGFTMIELVFVIVIIGILAAVALPRFTGISDDARVAKLQSFVGTLNRSVGPSIWSGILKSVPTANGSVTHTDAQAVEKYASIFDSDATGKTTIADAQVQVIPSELVASHDLSLSNCNASSTAIPAVGVAGGATAAGTTAFATSVGIGGTTYAIGCIDGNLNQAVGFFLYDVSTDKIIVK